MGELRIDSPELDQVEFIQEPSDQPDGLTLCLAGIAFVMALGLGVQKWFLATKYSLLIEHFGITPGWVTWLVVSSPRILTIPLVAAGFGVASLGFRSRKMGLLVAIGLLVANIVMFAVMFEIELTVLEANKAAVRSLFRM